MAVSFIFYMLKKVLSHAFMFPIMHNDITMSESESCEIWFLFYCVTTLCSLLGS